MSDLSSVDIQYNAGVADDGTIIVTSQSSNERMERILWAALQKYDRSKEQYSAGFSESTSSDTLTVARIDELATGITTNLSNVLESNRQVRKYIVKDDVLGGTYTAVQSNINTDYKLIYGSTEGRNKKKQLATAKQVIEQFNRSIKLKRLIRESVMTTFTEGNYIMYLRLDGGNAVIDYYPLGIAEITDYSINGDPVVQININEFKNRLRKTYTKDKRGRAMYFENLDKEVKANFPPEVYQAYKNGDTYCRLDVSRTGVMRINNMGYRYGVSQFFRALRPTVILEGIEDADIINNKAKAKKIIHQKLRKEIMGPDKNYQLKGFDYAAYAHQELMAAWQNQTVVYTSIPAVEEISYIEPAAEGTPTEKIALYRNEKMTALGVTFVDPEVSSVSTANISLRQLMKTIDSIAEQLSDILHKYYCIVLQANGLDDFYAPDIIVLDSEQMELEIKKQLVELLFSKLNLSYATCLEVLGLDVDDEISKREAENEIGVEQIFTPHSSQYTSGDPGSGGRPSGNNPDSEGKREYDQDYNDIGR